MTTEKLARFCSELKFKDLPSEIVQKTKELILDHIGVALGGSTLSSSRVLLDLVKMQGGKEESSILGSTIKVPSPNAAFVNGSSAHGPELDDTEPETALHPGAAIIPAALSLAETNHLNGASFITSVVGGYEVGLRVMRTVQGDDRAHYRKGFHGTGTCGTFGAAAAAGIALGLDSTRFESAFGLAGSQAAGLLEYLADGSWSKRFHPARAARDGVVSALLANMGFTGPKTVLEGRFGFVRAYSDNPDSSRLTEDLGKRFFILNVGIKPHSCCRYIQASIDATLDLVKRFDIKAGDVEKVDVEVVSTAILLLAEPKEVRYRPRTVVDAQFSIPYGVAVAILKGQVFIDDFTDEAIKNGEVLKLADKVTFTHNKQLDKYYPKYWPAKVTITLKNGVKRSHQVKTSKGDAEDPLSKQELEEKFRNLAGRVVASKSVEELISHLNRLEKLDDVSKMLGSISYK